MAAKTVKKTPAKTAKREPTPAAVLKKVSAISDSTKALQKEIKSMSKIFADNQKVLVSMKGMIDTLTLAIENIQRQSKQINILEDDTQKIYAGLNQVRSQSGMITKINAQTVKLQEEVAKITKTQRSSPKPEELHQQAEDSMNGIRNNSKMIIKIAQRIDGLKDDLRDVSAKADSLLDVKSEMGQLKDAIDQISAKTDKIGADSDTISKLRRELEELDKKTASSSSINSELDSIKASIHSITEKASKIDSFGSVLDGLKRQFEHVSSKVESASYNIESLRSMAAKIDGIETEINSLSHRADSTAFVGEGLKSVQEDLSGFKQKVFDKTDGIEQQIAAVSDTLKRQDQYTAEFHKKSDVIFSEMQAVKSSASKASSDSSKEMMALLRLSKYQSSIRMLAETKYGKVTDLKSMASQTAEIVNLFDRVSIESGQNIPLPGEVRQWAISKILECADRWEIRFGDVYSVLVEFIGRDMLKESIRIQQVRDIYGIRAVDEIRDDLNIT